MKLSDDWIIGFTEGEGCFFTYSRKGRKCKTAGFCITQKEKEILEEIKQFFGFGYVTFQPYEPYEGTNGVHRYHVTKYENQLFLKDFFEGRLRSETKRVQFEQWKITLENWGEHFTHSFRPWTESEVATAKIMTDNGYTQKQIGMAVNRTWRGVEWKKSDWKKSVSASGVEA